MKPIKVALLPALALATALLTVGCTPAHKNLVDQGVQLPLSIYTMFKISQPNASPALLKSLRKQIAQCYFDSEKKLGDTDWSAIQAAFDFATKFRGDKPMRTRQDLIDQRHEWDKMQSGRFGQKLVIGAAAWRRWSRKSESCLHQAYNDATQKARQP